MEKYVPDSMKQLITTVKERFQDELPVVGEIFETCFQNTLHTTIKPLEDGTTFVITGDIPAMWLRDSAAQVRPYLILAEQDPAIADMIEGVVKRQFQYVLHDPYANAFNETANGQGHHQDHTEMTPLVWERKYEIDSLCYPIQLAYLLWKVTGRTRQFNEYFTQAVNKIIDLWTIEQDHEQQSPYRFDRDNCPPIDTLSRNGMGSLVAPTGMTWSGFRPSDDACQYGYLIPSNMFAVVVLRYLQEIAEIVLQDHDLHKRAGVLLDEIEEGIQQHARVQESQFGEVFAYEVDGRGNYLLMDDANVPSLLSLPYLGYCSPEDPIYLQTRKLLLSKTNPTYYEGTYAKGIGSPHTPPNYIWPIALSIQGMTTTDQEEKRQIIQLLTEIDGGTKMMHEGVDVNDPTQFTREWFSWANMMFCELVLDYCGIHVKGSPLASYSTKK